MGELSKCEVGVGDTIRRVYKVLRRREEGCGQCTRENWKFFGCRCEILQSGNEM